MDDQMERLKKLLEEDRGSEEFKLETLILEVTQQIEDLMDERGVSKVELAQALGVAPPRVTRLLDDTNNFTLRTLVRIASALGRDLCVGMPERGFKPAYLYVSPTRTVRPKTAAVDYGMRLERREPAPSTGEYQATRPGRIPVEEHEELVA